MNPGDSETMFVDELRAVDEQALSISAESATHDDEFRIQQQKSDRLIEYYDEVVIELRALLGELHDEGS